MKSKLPYIWFFLCCFPFSSSLPALSHFILTLTILLKHLKPILTPYSSSQLTVVPPVTQMTHLKKRRMKSVIWRAEDCTSCSATCLVWNLWPLFAGRGSNKCAAVLWVAQCEIRGTLLNFMASSRSAGNKAVWNEPQLPRDLTRRSWVIKHTGTFSWRWVGWFRAHLLHRYFKTYRVFSHIWALLWEEVEILLELWVCHFKSFY